MYITSNVSCWNETIFLIFYLVDLLIQKGEDLIFDLVDFAYPNFVHNMKNLREMKNGFILNLIPGEIVEHLSSIRACKSNEDLEIYS